MRSPNKEAVTSLSLSDKTWSLMEVMQQLVVVIFFAKLSVQRDYNGPMCHVSHPEDLKTPCNSTVLFMTSYQDQSIVDYPEFYDYVKDMEEYDTFHLRFYLLERFTEKEVIRLHNGSDIAIMDNDDLIHIPKFEWDEDDHFEIALANNPKLDTSELRTTLKNRNRSTANVQRPFSCGETRIISDQCRIIEGTLLLDDTRNTRMLNLEELYGRISLVNSQLESVPAMPHLRKVEYTKIENSEPYAIKIVNNTRLKSIGGLTKIEELVVVSHTKSVLIRDNPKLCIEPEDAATDFVKKYASHVMVCGKSRAMNDVEQSFGMFFFLL
ncbi:hypothetical protein Y032_0274g1009 [Ancylostoma ceylanicum]|uniref:Receptor L-domain domain-containing protein n=1 Tax=Ancylostoma ceylanicum TaxID=53326 RepID=A0A016S8B3_9BILA|nr:hypothetical protein Y032_0274g1009 [Ancylostoma ceylanicum]